MSIWQLEFCVLFYFGWQNETEIWFFFIVALSFLNSTDRFCARVNHRINIENSKEKSATLAMAHEGNLVISQIAEEGKRK